MSQETEAILRSLLFQALTTRNRDRDFMLYAIKAMCSKDLIAAVEKDAQEIMAKEERNRDECAE